MDSLSKPPRTLYKPRSQVGEWVGSHNCVQRVLEPLFRIQTNVWVLDSQTLEQATHPLPPAPCHVRAGATLNFFPLFVGKGFCMTINRKEYTHGV